MTDDLLYHGDLNAALRRMMQQGFRDREGRDVSGMRELLKKLREPRRRQHHSSHPDGLSENITLNTQSNVRLKAENKKCPRYKAPQSGAETHETLAEPPPPPR